jgi:hypothetical protein
MPVPAMATGAKGPASLGVVNPDEPRERDDPTPIRR